MDKRTLPTMIKQLIHLFCFSSILFSSLAYANTIPGVTAGEFSVDSSGAATYQLPIVVPPGTGGMIPSLSLSYNSNTGNGLLGQGWSLGGLSVITRCPATKVQDGFIDGVDFDANVTFEYETRDTSTMYFAGSKIITDQRLKNIKTTVDNELVRDYQLTYENEGGHTAFTTHRYSGVCE